MQIVISLLRGVNMAGHNKMKMTGLSSLFKEAGFHDAETYIQSGNVVFTDPESVSETGLTEKIEGAIREKFGYDIPVINRTHKELKSVLSRNPFAGEENFDTEKLAVIFLYEKPSESQLGKVKGVNYPPDKFMISGKEIFIYCPNGFGRSKIYTGFFEGKMKVTGTGRNWKTVNALIQIAEKKRAEPAITIKTGHQ
jgi:uncharacterized protein (DUF1697 family)